jgi:hypothetical protein
MDFAGLVGKFKVNRQLTEQEKKQQLYQNKRIDIEPHYQLSVITMNSTYLESVDKWYESKGTITAVSLTIIFMFTAAFAGLLHVALTRENFSGISSKDLAVLIFAGVLFTPLLASATWLLLKDSFSFTHYPIIFNRKNHIVYVFRKNGSVLALPWNQIVFTMSQVDHGHKFFNVLGHWMAEDGVTVKESFSLSISSIGDADGLAVLRSHWEFVRRYMEDGPAAVTGQIQFCLPIKGRHEPLWFGVQRLLANGSGAPLMWPVLVFTLAFNALIIPFRFIAMRTSKLPRWPAEIEAALRIEDGDPYAIVGTEKGDRVSLYPAAAEAADVRFTGPPGNPLVMPGSTPPAGSSNR